MLEQAPAFLGHVVPFQSILFLTLARMMPLGVCTHTYTTLRLSASSPQASNRTVFPKLSQKDDCFEADISKFGIIKAGLCTGTLLPTPKSVQVGVWSSGTEH